MVLQLRERRSTGLRVHFISSTMASRVEYRRMPRLHKPEWSSSWTMIARGLDEDDIQRIEMIPGNF